VEDILCELGKAPVAPKEVHSSEISPFPEVKEVFVESIELAEKLRDRLSGCFTKESMLSESGSNLIIFLYSRIRCFYCS
jgi:hypothetical protein